MNQQPKANVCRLFIGNLRTEQTSYDEIKERFGQYGTITEVSLKEKYGFIQFTNAESVQAAIAAENGTMVGDGKIDLKLATGGPKGDQNRNNNNNNSNNNNFRKPMTNNAPQGQFQNNNRRGIGPNRPFQNRHEPYNNIQQQQNRFGPRRNLRGGGGGNENFGGGPNRLHQFQNQGRGMVKRGGGVVGGMGSHQHLAQQDFRSNVDVQMLFIGNIDREWTSQIDNALQYAGFRTGSVSINPQTAILDEVIQKTLSSGVRMYILIDQSSGMTRTVSIQLYEFDGTFKEYSKVNLSMAVDIMMKDRMEWMKRNQNTPPSMSVPQPTYGKLNAAPVYPNSAGSSYSSMNQLPSYPTSYPPVDGTNTMGFNSVSSLPSINPNFANNSVDYTSSYQGPISPSQQFYPSTPSTASSSYGYNASYLPNPALVPVSNVHVNPAASSSTAIDAINTLLHGSGSAYSVQGQYADNKAYPSQDQYALPSASGALPTSGGSKTQRLTSHVAGNTQGAAAYMNENDNMSNYNNVQNSSTFEQYNPAAPMVNNDGASKAALPYDAMSGPSTSDLQSILSALK